MAKGSKGGCSFALHQLTFNEEDDTTPSAGITQDYDAANIAFVRDQQVFNIHIEPVCSGLVIEPEELLNTAAAGFDPSNVDVTVAPGQNPDAYVVWEASVSFGLQDYRHVFFKRNRNAGMVGSWQGSDASPQETDLTALAGFSESDSTEPVLSADTFSATSADSSATLLFVNDANCGLMTPRCLMFLRSRDSGVTFSGDPFTPSSPPLIVGNESSPAPVSAWSPAQDANDSGLGQTAVWYAGVWQTDDGFTGNIFMDAQAEDGSAVLASWNNPAPTDVPVQETTENDARAPAISLLPPELGSLDAPEFFVFWDDDLAGLHPGEILYKPGLFFDDMVQPKILLPCENGPFQLTGEYPPRTGGQADSIASHNTAEDVFLAFRDTRDGQSEIYFKRSDHVAPSPLGTITASLLPCPDVRIQLEWSEHMDCDVDHYRVLYDTDGGPDYDSSVNGIEGTSVEIGGLDPLTDYYYVVTVVDQACNESDPSAEGMITTGTCEAVLRPVLPVHFEDRCNLPGYGDGNGMAEPGETLQNIYLDVENIGSGTATGCTATLTSPTPGVTIMPPGSSFYPDIASGFTETNISAFTAELSYTDFQCGSFVDLDLTGRCDQGRFDLRYSIPTDLPCTICGTVQLELQAVVFDDHCLSDPSSPGEMDGSADPGEDIAEIFVTVRNTGDRDLTGNPVTATLSVNTPGATADPGAREASFGMSLAVGSPQDNETAFAVNTNPNLGCPGVIDAELDFGGPLTPVAFTLPVDAPCDSCWTPCPELPEAIRFLLLAKSDDDIILEWQEDWRAFSGYNVWYVTGKTDIPEANMDNCPPAAGVPFCATPDQAWDTTCIHQGALAGPSEPYFYQVKGYCYSEEGP